MSTGGEDQNVHVVTWFVLWHTEELSAVVCVLTCLSFTISED